MGIVDTLYKIMFFSIFVVFVWVVLLTKFAQFFGTAGLLAYVSATIVTLIVGIPLSMLLSETLKNQLDSMV